MREGDEVVVNVAALDLGLGSGGFDVVHVNLTRGLEGGGDAGDARDEAQLHLAPAPGRARSSSAAGRGRPAGRERGRPVLVLPLHGHLAPAAWAAAQAAPGLRVGYVQTAGGALPGSLSRDVAELRERGLLCGHVTAAPAYGGEHEAISVAGALDAAADGSAGTRRSSAPGPGIIGSDTRFGHGGMAALDSAHAALALGLPTLLSPRLSAADPRDAPPRRQPPHPHRARTAARAGRGAVPEGESAPIAALSGRSRRRHRLRSRPSISTATRRAGCRRGRWAAGSRRTRCSSPPRCAGGPSLGGEPSSG